jgi:nucleolar protein 53
MKDLLEERKRLKELKLKQNENNPKRLGKEKIPETDIEVLLPHEVPKSLRQIKPPTTSLLEDRFHSFQKRNMIEPRSAKDYERRYSMKLKTNIRYREFMDDQDKKYPDKK